MRAPAHRGPARPFEQQTVQRGRPRQLKFPADGSGRPAIRSLQEAQSWADATFGLKGLEHDYRLSLTTPISSAKLFCYAPGGSALVTFTFGLTGPASNYVTACEPVQDYASVASRLIDRDHGFS
jgi:hypothetical protein